VSVSWTAVSGATSYNLYWSTTTGITTATGTKVTGATSPSAQTGLADGTAFFYIVTAVNSAGESVASSQATASTNAAAIDGAALYATNCSGCHGPLATSTHHAASAAQIMSGIAGVSSMRNSILATNGTALTVAQIAAISAALQ
jgi:mono/diheme cytochrome c family protein